MRLILWLRAAATAQLPCPAAHGRCQRLKLRGGGLQQTLDALPHDAKALAASFVVLGGFDKFVQHLAASETISGQPEDDARRPGPLFLLCWPLFSREETAKNWAMVGPLALTLKAAAAGSGLTTTRRRWRRCRARATAEARGACPLRRRFCGRDGPVLARAGGVLALVAPRAAGCEPRRFGPRHSAAMVARLPWCRRKSFVGTGAFFVATTLGGAAFAYFRGLGWWSVLQSPDCNSRSCRRGARGVVWTRAPGTTPSSSRPQSRRRGAPFLKEANVHLYDPGRGKSIALGGWCSLGPRPARGGSSPRSRRSSKAGLPMK